MRLQKYGLQKTGFRRPFRKEHGKRSQTLLKSAQQHLYDIYWLLSRKFIWKKSPLGIFKILGLFLKTLTANDKYSLLNRDILTEPAEMKESKN